MIPGIVAGAPFAGVPWTPAQLSPALWLNDDSPVTDAGGGACSQWNDIGVTAARHFVQATGSRQPTITPAGLNGRRVITFDGSGDVLDGTATCAALTQNAGQLCVFIVANPTPRGTTTVARLLNFSVGLPANSSFRAGLAMVSNNFRLAQRRLDTDTVNNNELPHASKAWRIHEATYNWASGSSTLRLDGGTPNTQATGQGSGNTSNTPSTYVELGGTATATDQDATTAVAELVVLTSLPSTLDRQRMEGYLAHRWGLAANLDPAHPYKSSPP